MYGAAGFTVGYWHIAYLMFLKDSGRDPIESDSTRRAIKCNRRSSPSRKVRVLAKWSRFLTWGKDKKKKRDVVAAKWPPLFFARKGALGTYLPAYIKTANAPLWVNHFYP